MFILQGLYFIIILIVFDSRHEKNITFIQLISIEYLVKSSEASKGVIFGYEVIVMLTNFLLILLTCVFWVKQVKYKHSLDEKSSTDADFAVMFQNLPLDTSKKDLHELVKKAGVDPECIVYSCKCYEFRHILNLKKQQFRWLLKKKYLEMFREKHHKEVTADKLSELYPSRSLFNWPPWKKFPKQEEIEAKLDSLQDQLMEENMREVKYCGTTIVVMKTEHDADTVISHYKRKGCLKLWPSDTLYAKRCPEPSDIIWENVPYSKKKRRCVTTLIYLI